MTVLLLACPDGRSERDILRTALLNTLSNLKLDY